MNEHYGWDDARLLGGGGLANFRIGRHGFIGFGGNLYNSGFSGFDDGGLLTLGLADTVLSALEATFAIAVLVVLAALGLAVVGCLDVLEVTVGMRLSYNYIKFSLNNFNNNHLIAIGNLAASFFYFIQPLSAFATGAYVVFFPQS